MIVPKFWAEGRAAALAEGPHRGGGKNSNNGFDCVVDVGAGSVPAEDARAAE